MQNRRVCNFYGIDSERSKTLTVDLDRAGKKSANCFILYGATKKVSRKLSMRVINVAAAQLGPIPKADSREAVVKRMVALMDEAKAKGADLIVYPELALTTFFPRWYMTDQAEVDTWFEREMPNAAT